MFALGQWSLLEANAADMENLNFENHLFFPWQSAISFRTLG